MDVLLHLEFIAFVQLVNTSVRLEQAESDYVTVRGIVGFTYFFFGLCLTSKKDRIIILLSLIR
jgi:hypothetical protein